MRDALELIAYPTDPERVRALEEDGFVYLPGVLRPEQVVATRAHMAALQPDPAAFDHLRLYGEHSAGLDKHIKVIFNRHPFFVQFLDMPPVIEVAEGAMGEDCHIIGMTAWMNGAGRPDQRLHVDWLPLEAPEELLLSGQVKVPVFIATAHYYLDDLFEELGPTKVITGSHRAGRKPGDATDWHGVKEQSLLCKAGDVVMFRSDVWHRGSANTSNQTRFLLQVHYARRMIAQKFPPYLQFQFNPECLAIATPRQRRLLGDHVRANYD